jgi:ABC-type phosphate transport system auxiliary subunit
MKEQLWNLALYAVIFGIVYYQSYAENDWWLTIAATTVVIGFVNISATALAILWYGLIWFWDATVNYSKNRKQDNVDEINE